MAKKVSKVKKKESIPKVSIVLPLYKPDKVILTKVYEAIKKQKFSGKIEIIPVEKNWGMAKQMNYGINKSKYDIVVTLPQDCIPASSDWLEKLIEPFKDPAILAANSKVHLPEKLWNKFDYFAKAMTLKEKGVITPLLDEKGTAYRKSAFIKIGLFNEKIFRTAGEDFDAYIKIKSLGKIAYPECKVFHIHPTSGMKRLIKEHQYSNGFGALVRIHGTKMPNWYMGILKAIPFAGLIFFIMNYSFKRGLYLFPYHLAISPFSHIIYLSGFWKGFLMKKQTI